VFSDSLQEAKLINDHLRSLGVRSALYHGGLNEKARDDVRLGFQPETGEPRYDAVVATSAAEAGINMQRASAIHHYDVPMTEKSHAQRTGRAYRQGQLGDVDVHNWHTNSEYERNARARLKSKLHLAEVFQTPLANLDQTGIGLHHARVLAEKQQAA